MSDYETYEEWTETCPEQWEPIYGPGGGKVVKVPPCWAHPKDWDWAQGSPPTPGGPWPATRDGWDAGRIPLLRKTEQALEKLYTGDTQAAIRILRGMVSK